MHGSSVHILNLQTRACKDTHACTHARTHACIHVSKTLYLRSHTPFSLVVLPSDAFVPSNTRASLKLTSQESSDSSPDEQKRGVRGSSINPTRGKSPTVRSLTCLSVVKLFFAVHTEQSSDLCPRRPASFQASQTSIQPGQERTVDSRLHLRNNAQIS